MSSKETQVDERSEGYVENTPELAIASSVINSKNGESTVVIDILEKDRKPVPPPKRSPIRTQDHQVYHGQTSGGHDVKHASPVSSAAIMYPPVPCAPCPKHLEGMFTPVFSQVSSAPCGETSGGHDVKHASSAKIKLPREAQVKKCEPCPKRLEKLYPKKDNDILIPRRKNSTDVEEVNGIESSSLKEKFKSLKHALVVEESQPKIQRVPSILREYDRSNGSYRPRMFSIGPYHHQAIPKREEGEKLKLKLAALFVQKHRLEKDDVLFEIKKEIEDLRRCYKKEEMRKSKERFKDDDYLTWMFFVDGCAILHYIDFEHQDTDEILALKVKVDILTFMQRDLFLLENQLPYRVLDIIMRYLNDKDGMRKSIEKFIFESFGAPWEKQDEEKLWKFQKEELPIHLLDLLRRRLLQSVNKEETPYSIVQQLINNVVKFIKEPVEKIQDLIECLGKAFENSTCLQTQDLHFFRSVEELKAAGVRIRPSNTGRLTDITYNLGTLKLPPIIVGDFTASKFLNLIAYEMCPDFVNDFGVTSYILFLDALIDGAQDVKELRDKHILHNALGSDEEVAKLFNEIGTNLVSNPGAYSYVKSAIQKRCGNRWMTWIAQFNHKHFQSSWSVLAFLGAIIVLVATLLQTVYTILGYHK